LGWLSVADRLIVTAALNRLVPSGDSPTIEPGAGDAGGADYIDGLLDAFATDPPRIFAGGPASGRRGGEPGFAAFLPLTRVQEIAWRQRIADWHAAYRAGLTALGADFAQLDPDEQDARLDGAAEFKALLYEHACEGFYAAPEYGGNRGLAGWRLAEWAGDVAPTGWTDAEVSNP
jgi:gluconate 2-dehydrogenase gamma chain